MPYSVRGIREGSKVYAEGRFFVSGAITSPVDVAILKRAGHTLEYSEPEAFRAPIDREKFAAILAEQAATERQIAKRWREIYKPLKKSTHDPAVRRYGRPETF